ncbi:MAG: tetratricopeptide repeat protein [Flavobacteriales bacterium]|nr:tetratricopeptide repeat protein [Flavobacteriales bacterium]
MKKHILYTLLIVSACALITACSDLSGNTSTASAPPSQIVIPELVQRTAQVGLPGEYEKTKMQYDQFKNAYKKHPEDLKNIIRLSEIFITEARITGNYGPNQAAALSLLDHVLSKTASKSQGVKDIHGQALTLKALIKLSQHQFAEALTLGEEAVKLDPNKAFNYGVLVDANVELGNYEKAVVMSDKMVATRPDLQSYGRVSYLREIHGDMTGAITAMEMAVKAGYPGSDETSWCHVQLGGLHERSGDLATAAIHYADAITERPGYPFALAAAGRVAGKQKNFAQAEADLKQAIATMPDAHFYMDLARIYKAQGKNVEYDEAVRKAEETLIGLSGEDHDHADNKEHVHAAHGHSHEVGLEMARFELEFHHDLPAALKNAEHEFEHREKNIDVNAVMVAILMEKGEFGGARAHLDMAKATGSKSADLILLEGLLQTKNGNTAEGEKLINAALKHDPSNAFLIKENAIAAK